MIQELTGLPVGPSTLRQPTAKTTRRLQRRRLRKKTRETIERRAKRTPQGKFIDPNTGEVIEGKFHYGHITGREHRRLVAQGERREMTQKEFNDWVNSHPEWFQIEDAKSNLSHRYEKPGND